MELFYPNLKLKIKLSLEKSKTNLFLMKSFIHLSRLNNVNASRQRILALIQK